MSHTWKPRVTRIASVYLIDSTDQHPPTKCSATELLQLIPTAKLQGSHKSFCRTSFRSALEKHKNGRPSSDDRPQHLSSSCHDQVLHAVQVESTGSLCTCLLSTSTYTFPVFLSMPANIFYLSLPKSSSKPSPQP
jgi:hypothetical protein